MLKKSLFVGILFALLAGCGDGLPDEGDAKEVFLKVVEKSDKGCVELSSFEITDRKARNNMGTDKLVFSYKAEFTSLDTCYRTRFYNAFSNRAVTGFSGFYRQQMSRIDTKVPSKAGDKTEVKGEVILVKTVDGWVGLQ